MYESYFDLREPAFSITPDSRFVWLSPTAEEGLAALYYGIQHRKGFILLTGDIGAGKTTLLRAVLRCLPKESLDEPGTALVMNTAGLTQLDLLKLVAAEFQITPKARGRADYIIGLDSFLLGRLRDGLNTVLIIDEAQNLSTQALEQVRLLSNLETESEKLLQIVLSGQPELREKLAAPKLEQLRQRVAVEHHIEPLLPEEVTRYLRHRVQVAGGNYDQIFAPGCDKVIARFSGGRPRVINNLVDRVLVAAYGRRLRPVPESFLLEKAREMVSAMAVAPPKPDPELELTPPEPELTAPEPEPTPCIESSPTEAIESEVSEAREATEAPDATGGEAPAVPGANGSAACAMANDLRRSETEDPDESTDEALEAAAEDFLFEDAGEPELPVAEEEVFVGEEDPLVADDEEEDEFLDAPDDAGTFVDASDDAGTFVDASDDAGTFVDASDDAGWDWGTTPDDDEGVEASLATTSEEELAELTDDDEEDEFLDAALEDEPGEPTETVEAVPRDDTLHYEEVEEADSTRGPSGFRYVLDEGTGELERNEEPEIKREPLTLDISRSSFWTERAVLINGSVQVLAAALFAVAPLLLEMAGLSESLTWRFASGALAVFSGVIVAGGVATRISRHYEFVGGDIVVWLYAIHVSIAACLGLHALGALPASGPLFYTLGLVWLLAMASLNFALLALRGRPPTGPNINSPTA
jgi:general secretion pathway protein A